MSDSKRKPLPTGKFSATKSKEKKNTLPTSMKAANHGSQQFPFFKIHYKLYTGGTGYMSINEDGWCTLEQEGSTVLILQNENFDRSNQVLRIKNGTYDGYVLGISFNDYVGAYSDDEDCTFCHLPAMGESGKMLLDNEPLSRFTPLSKSKGYLYAWGQVPYNHLWVTPELVSE